eukprot:8848716-Lingulodinium_polyedra.AAC.1
MVELAMHRVRQIQSTISQETVQPRSTSPTKADSDRACGSRQYRCTMYSGMSLCTRVFQC